MKLIQKFQHGKGVYPTSNYEVRNHNGNRKIVNKNTNEVVANAGDYVMPTASVSLYSAKDRNGQPIRDTNGRLITGSTQEEAQRNYNNRLLSDRDLMYKYQTPSKGIGGVQSTLGLEMTPVIGDIYSGYHDVYKPLSQGDYLSAGIGVGMFLLPNIIEKPMSKLYHGIKTLVKPSFTKRRGLAERRANVRFIQKFNKWNDFYGYPHLNLNLSKNSSKLDDAIKDRMIEHNTFVRGVRDAIHKEDIKRVNDILLSRGLAPTFENRLKFFATSYAPKTNAGRAGTKQLIAKDDDLGVTYTSNSLGTGIGYASPQHQGETLGKVFKVQRPVDFSSNKREDWIIDNDFFFDQYEEMGSRNLSKDFYNQDIPVLMKTGKTKEELFPEINEKYERIRKQYKPNINFNSLLEQNMSKKQGFDIKELNDFNMFLSKLPKELSDIVQNSNISNFYKNLTLSEKSYFLNWLKDVSNRTNINSSNINYYIQDFLGNIHQMFNTPEYLNTQKQYNQIIENFNNRMSQAKFSTYQKALLNSKLPYLNKESSGIVTSEYITKEPYQHFIFLGKPNTQSLKLIEEIPFTPGGSRFHDGVATEGFSRKSYKFGGKLIN